MSMVTQRVGTARLFAAAAAAAVLRPAHTRVLVRTFTALSRAPFRHAPAPAALAPSHIELSACHSTAAAAASTRANAPSPRLADTNASSAMYELLLQRLYQVNRFTAVKLGIENMKQLNAAFGDPASQYPVLHVAGTNGKGSVAFKLAKALERAGYRTGLFVSPHVACFRERIQINGDLISEDATSELLAEVFNVSAQLRIPATFFELTTMLAFQHFAKHRVDCVVLETGLGGRLDATNIVTPAVSIITSIGLDHTRILGDSIDAIAREKAGIIKPNVPVVLGPNAPLRLFQNVADARDAPLTCVPAHPAFANDVDAENTAVATAALEALSSSSRSELVVDVAHPRVAAALAMRPPCRFEVIHLVRPNSTERKVTVVLDVAHNPPAIARLVTTLRERFPTQTLRFVCGFSADKDLRHVLSTILETTRHNASVHDVADKPQERIHLVQARSPRAASLEEINHALGGAMTFASIATIHDGVHAAVAAARATSHDDVVVVCGSVFVMAEARQALGFNEPIDSETLSTVAGGHLSTPESRLAAHVRR